MHLTILDRNEPITSHHLSFVAQIPRARLVVQEALRPNRPTPPSNQHTPLRHGISLKAWKNPPTSAATQKKTDSKKTTPDPPSPAFLKGTPPCTNIAPCSFRRRVADFISDANLGRLASCERPIRLQTGPLEPHTQIQGVFRLKQREL